MAVLVSAGLPTYYANGRKIVRLSDGTLYCVYHRTEAARWQIYVQKSVDDGATWTDETRISTYAGMELYHQGVPSIATDSSDNLHVVWQGCATGFTSKFQIWHNKYDGAWAGPVRISDYAGMATKGQRYPSIAVDGSDNLHVVWDGMATGFISDYQIWYNKYDGAWAGPVRISTTAEMEFYEQLQAAIAIDSNGYLHVVWSGETAAPVFNKIYYNKYDGAWAGPVRISTYAGMSGNSQGGQSIAIDSNDYIHVVWYGMAAGFATNPSIWYNKYDGAWAGPVRISTYPWMGTTFAQSYPSVAVDSFDNVHAVWCGMAEDHVGTERVWHAKYVTSWGTPECVQTMGTDLSNPNIRWSRYPSSNIPANGIDYVFTEAGANIYWDKVGSPFAALPTATSDDATAIAARTADLNGTLDDDGNEPCDCGFEWGETIAYGNTTPTQSRTTGQTFTQALAGLDPNTTYHFRAFATNGAGTGHGADRTFTTPIALATLATNPATGRGLVIATFNGILNNDGGEACECGFEWGTDITYGATTPTDSKVTGETFSQLILGLFPDTEYHFRAFARNSVGTSFGADESFRSEPSFSRSYALAREEL